MTDINVEEIMEQIREEIREKGYREEDLSFNDVPLQKMGSEMMQFDEKTMLSYLSNAKQTYRVDFYKPIEGGLKGFMKKLVRKLAKPILLHLCQEQEEFNSSSIKAMEQLYAYNKVLEDRIDHLERILEKRLEQ